jgi:hypothetical protein
LFVGSAPFAALPTPAVGPIPAGVPTLRNAVALATLVRIDSNRAQAEFRVSCGWHIARKEKIRAGFWVVDLRHGDFGIDTVSRADWEKFVEAHGWTGTLRIVVAGAGISNGPTTDVCHGDLG